MILLGGKCLNIRYSMTMINDEWKASKSAWIVKGSMGVGPGWRVASFPAPEMIIDHITFRWVSLLLGHLEVERNTSNSWGVLSLVILIKSVRRPFKYSLSGYRDV
jgi:hypothetical protein